MQKFKKLIFLLSVKERKQASILLIMILIMAILDMIGVASILPFMLVLTDPNLIETNFILKELFQIFNLFGIKSNQQFIFALGVVVFLLLIISLSFKALTTYFQVRFVQMREYSIGKRLVEGYLNQPYSWFLNRHSAELGKTILSEVQQIIGNGIRPSLELIAKSAVSIALIVLLFLTNPKLTLIITFLIGGLYITIFYFIRNFLIKIGKKRLLNNQSRFTVLSEAFGASKEVKITGLEKNFLKLFSESARNLAQTQSYSQIISQLPRFILEGFAFGGIILIILFIMSKTGSFNQALPILSLYVFAGYRLIPAFQQIYASLTQLSFVGPSIDKLYDDLKNLKPIKEKQNQEVLSYTKNIALNNVCYSYPNTAKTAINDISLNIPVNSTVGFVGATGSGKTTVLDIILGLLEPQEGNLQVDDRVIVNQNVKSWQKFIGYVPQNIFLSDDTVEANIAFGMDAKDINPRSIEKASKIANLHDFVINELPEKYQTFIGERGVRLSGGQRQRIGIARALYRNPKVLILDEATSALDNQTEKAVMEAVNNLEKNVTIIIVAHRLTTVKNCDTIFIIDKGELKDQGKYKDLLEFNEQFRDSAKHI